MSDAVILGLITAVTSTVSVLATIWGNKKVAVVEKEIVTVKDKVTVVHEQVNSKMDKQLKMTKALAKAEQKVEDAINGKHKIMPDKKKVPVKRKK